MKSVDEVWNSSNAAGAPAASNQTEMAMSTQRKSHNNHQIHRTTNTPHGGERGTQHVQPRNTSPDARSSATSKAPAPQAPRPRAQLVESPRASSHKVTPLTQEAISRMTSAIAKQNGGGVPKDSYIADMQSRFDKREAARSPSPSPAPAPQRAQQKKR